MYHPDCEQGKEIKDLKQLENKVLREVYKILKQKNWIGFLIKPIRIEFMKFKDSRFHDRKLYEIENDRWIVKQIQP